MSRFRPDFNNVNITPGGAALTNPFPSMRPGAVVEPVKKTIAKASDTARRLALEYPERSGGLLIVLGIYLSMHIFPFGEFVSTLLFGGARVPVVGIIAVLVNLSFMPVRRLFEFMKSPIAVPWVLYALWLIPVTLFSTFKSGSFSVTWPYVLRFHIMPFFACAVALRARHVRYLIYAAAGSSFLLVFLCIGWGAYSDGRFAVPLTPAVSNPNDLAITMLVAGAFTMLMLYRGGGLRKFLWFVSISLTLIFVFRTASRSNFLTIVAALALLFAFAPRSTKTTLSMLSPLLVVIAIVAVPSNTWTRLTFLFVDPSTIQVQDPTLAGALGSQIARTELQARALQMTVQNPLFGVGPGQYAAVADELVRATTKQKSGWQDAHNVYLQIGAETGVPGFIFYTWTIIATIVLAFKTLRRCTREPALAQYLPQCLAIVIAATVFGIGIAFVNFAFSALQPIITAFAAANALALEREVQIAQAA